MPNYGLSPEHIKRFSRGGGREAYITLQWIKKPDNFDPKMLVELQAIQNAGIEPSPVSAHGALQNVDALFEGTGESLPSTVILDYLYGIAAYKAWRSGREHDGDEHDDSLKQMDAYRNEHYVKIPPLSPQTDDTDDTDVASGPDDPNDSEYIPQEHYLSTRRSGLEEAMDELQMFLMNICGITPEMAAERRQKEIEREEQAAQEASRNKVMEWRNHLDVY